MCVVKTAFLFTFLQSFQIVWWIRYLNWFRPPHAGQPRQKEERRPKYGLSQYTHIWAGLQPLCPDTNTEKNETQGNLPGTSPSPLLTGHPISNIDFWTEMSRLHISFFSVNLYFNWKGFRLFQVEKGFLWWLNHCIPPVIVFICVSWVSHLMWWCYDQLRLVVTLSATWSLSAQRGVSCIKLSSVTDLSSRVRPNNSSELIRHERNVRWAFLVSQVNFAQLCRFKHLRVAQLETICVRKNVAQIFAVL